MTPGIDAPEAFLRDVVAGRAKDFAGLPATQRWRRAANAIIALTFVSCSTPAEQMKADVREQAMRDLACDPAALSITQLRPTQKVVDGRRGKVERTTYSAKGCGDYRAYVVECARGNCRVDAIVEDPETKAKRLQGETP